MWTLPTVRVLTSEQSEYRQLITMIIFTNLIISGSTIPYIEFVCCKCDNGSIHNKKVDSIAEERWSAHLFKSHFNEYFQRF